MIEALGGAREGKCLGKYAVTALQDRVSVERYRFAKDKQGVLASVIPRRVETSSQ